MVSLSLPPKVVQRLEELARDSDRSVEDYIFQIIVNHLEDLEDIAAVKDFLRDDPKSFIPLEDVMREIEHDGAQSRRTGDAAE